MLFYSPEFLVFLPLVFILYWWVFSERASKLTFLLAASYVFYMSWSPKLIVLLLGSTLIDYFAVVWMQRTEDPWKRRALLGASIVFNIGMLSTFKYANFFLHDVAGPLTGWVPPHLDIVLPLGISFYTFETLSYVVDCYYKKTKPFDTLRDYAVFISFFPHLIAGPIIRPRQFLPQLKELRTLTGADIHVGAAWFLMGLVKKLVIADRFSLYADPVFADPAAHGTLAAWAGVAAYAGQIYFDFSGYSDMAIGIARLFCFDLPLNFRTPYLSRNVAEFWKRWHISLSSWLRDYLYAPLRGLAEGEWANYMAVFMTMFLGGLWHGANWTFVAWGSFHGGLLMAHRFLNVELGRFWKPAAALVPLPVRDVLSRALVFALACVGWVFFRAQDFGTAFEVLRRMFHYTAGAAPALAVPALLAVMFAYDVTAFRAESGDWDLEGTLLGLPSWTRVVLYAAALVVILVYTPMDARPFIYFQF
ncbi:MBOAT family protein [bacterium]|nr:MAG: MBOAT family protein [bacterium]